MLANSELTSENPQNNQHTELQNCEKFDLTTLEGWIKRFYSVYFPEIPENQIFQHFKNQLPQFIQDQTINYWQLTLKVRNILGAEKGDDFLNNSPP